MEELVGIVLNRPKKGSRLVEQNGSVVCSVENFSLFGDSLILLRGSITIGEDMSPFYVTHKPFSEVWELLTDNNSLVCKAVRSESNPSDVLITSLVNNESFTLRKKSGDRRSFELYPSNSQEVSLVLTIKSSLDESGKYRVYRSVNQKLSNLIVSFTYFLYLTLLKA